MSDVVWKRAVQPTYKYAACDQCWHEFLIDPDLEEEVIGEHKRRAHTTDDIRPELPR